MREQPRGEALRAEEELLVTVYEDEGRPLLVGANGVGWLSQAILRAGVGADPAGAPIFAMAQDKHGNHIVQRMLSRPDSSVRELAVAQLRSQRQKLQQGVGARYAKHVFAALDSIGSIPALPAATAAPKALDLPQTATPAGFVAPRAG